MIGLGKGAVLCPMFCGFETLGNRPEVLAVVQ